MENFESIISLITNQSTVFGFVLIILIALYGLFALIAAIQVSNLNKVVNQVGFAPILNVIFVAHFLASLALLFFAVLFL